MHFKRLLATSLATRLIALSAVVVAGSIYFLAYTAPGISWLLNTNLNDSTASISIDSVSRELGGKTTIKNLKYHSNSSDIVFETIVLHWNPLSIFSSQMHIESLDGQNLTVNIKSDEENSHSVIALNFPIATRVLNAHIKNLQINANGKPIYTVNETAIDNIYLEENFFAEKITFRASENRWLSLSGRFGFATNSVINLTTEAMVALPGKYGNFRAKGTVVGNAAQMRFLQQVDSPVAGEVTGRLRHLFTRPSWEIDSRITDTMKLAKSSNLLINDLTGSVSFVGDTKEFRIKSQLAFHDKSKVNWLANFNATSQESDLDFNVALVSQGARKSQANFSGSYHLKSVHDTTPIANRLKLKGDWKNIQLAFVENNLIASKSGSVEFNGELLSAQLTANELQLEKLGPTISRLEMNTKNVNKDELAFRGNASTSNGNLNMVGKVIKKRNNYKLDSLFLSGRNFPLVRKPNAHIIISPEVSFVRKDETMTSTGTVKIPTANIQLQDFQQTLAQITSFISSDIRKLKSAGSVDVEFGKSVWMHGYGLNAHVTGDLSLKEITNKQITASGELKVIRGNYRRLREDHQLQSGRLKFNNHDIDDPELDLTIVKRESTPKDLKKIVGRLQKLYSGSNRQLHKDAGVKRIQEDISSATIALNDRP